jgi:hypothetical protein
MDALESIAGREVVCGLWIGLGSPRGAWADGVHSLHLDG